MRSLIVFLSMIAVDPALLLRPIEIYEIDQLDFADAYLVARAETTGINEVASIDRSIDRITNIERVNPSEHRLVPAR